MVPPAERAQAAALQAARRAANPPRITYPPELPVSRRADEIAAAIRAHPVVIVSGETGSGKTTQLPKICITAGRGRGGQIAHTQPRRIAARAVAARIAHELGTPLGEVVGYKVRFSDRTRRDAWIKVVTDGILLAETQGDRDFRRYDTIIIDEAHERSLNIDFLLGYLKRLLARRADLKLIITSATLDAERFARHFAGPQGPAPLISVSGRNHPIEIRYRPLRTEGEEADDEEELEETVAATAEDLWREGAGDILVFLPGEREIRETGDVLRRALARRPYASAVEILPLYARMSVDAQQRVFAPSQGRRIVLATNVAETSLTVPGIRYVIDAGQARVRRYSLRNKTTLLQIEKISQAAANQRAGRCGRLERGICVRLYGEVDFAARPAYTDPEIRRSSLAAVILRMAALSLGDVAAFPFVDPPSARAIADGQQLLQELDALDAARKLTARGRELAKLPLDPRVGRIVLAARENGCLPEALVIASALAVPDPRERPLERAQAADQAHLQFHDARSDFLSLIALWEFFAGAGHQSLSHRGRVQECRARFVSFLRLTEWRDVHAQLCTALTEAGWNVDTTLPATLDAARYEAIHRALLAGLLGNIGIRATRPGARPGQFDGARGLTFFLHPGSGLAKKAPKWVLAAELIETTRLYARCAGRIEPEWIESVAGARVEREYFEPRWDRARGEVVASERSKLYGLTLLVRRAVSYGAIAPDQAREAFIREALVGGELAVDAPFLAHNRRLVAEVAELEDKTRRQDVLVDDETLAALYASRIPEGIHTRAGFEAWRRQIESREPGRLRFTRDELMRHAASSVTEALFPAVLEVAGAALPLKYRFAPGHPLDGLTLTVPLERINQVDIAALDWLVPGMLRDKVSHYLKALPKGLRNQLVPLPETVTAFLTREPDRRQRLVDALREFLRARLRGELPPQALDAVEVPDHLRMNLEVVDAAGNDLASGRDLPALRLSLEAAARLSFAAVEPSLERKGLRHWDVVEVPESLALERGGQRITGYPALVDEGDANGVALTLLDTREAADRASHRGVIRLIGFELGEALKQQLKPPREWATITLRLRSTVAPARLQEDLREAIAARAFLGDDPLPRSPKVYVEQVKRARARLPAVAEGAWRVLGAIAAEHHALSHKLGALPASLHALVAEAEVQRDALVYPGFLAATPWPRLQDLPRYLQALARRVARYTERPERDARHATQVAGWWQRYRERLESDRRAGRTSAGIEDFRWMLEELRVSLFAQELRTTAPVSFKRIERAWAAIGR
jgi:ATP-dependent helicase HrpA